MKLGSRGQLLAALLTVFALSFGLLSLATLRLTRHDATLSQTRHAEAYAALLLATHDGQDDGSLLSALKRLQDEGRVTAAVLHSEETEARFGSLAGEATGQNTRGARSLTLAVPAMGPRTVALERLLLFYVTLTGLSVMALAYLLLTWTIVRPLRMATDSAEALARGDLNSRMPLQGAAEVVRLSKAFNSMADALRNERQTLESRVGELERLTTELRETRNQVIHAEKLASVGRLSAGVAHEIGNPLAAILGMLELLQGERLSEQEQAEFLGRIQRETERIHGIITELLSYARRDSSDMPTDTQVVLNDVVEDVQLLLHNQLSARRIRCEVEVPEGLFVRAAAPQLTQVLLNLLLNAADAAGEDGHIRVHASSGDGQVILHVDDDGPGIEPAMAEQLFEPFTTTKHPGQGTGLGLFVTHALVERMGGRVQAGSAPDGGARFSVTLNVADD